MTDWPIGLSTGCFYQFSIFDVLEDIRNGGFTLLEFCSFPKHLDYHDLEVVKAAADRTRDLGLEPFSFHAPFHDSIDITCLDEANRERSVREHFAACEAAAILGVKHLVLHPGPEQEGKPDPTELFARMENGAQSLNRVAAKCRELGINLLLENMLPHLLFGHASDMLYMLGAIQETNVGTCLDTGHANLSGDLSTVVHKLSGHLKMLHVNDNKGDCDAHLAPPHGSIDWHRLVSELVHYRFQGSLILELAGSDNHDRERILGQARESRKYLKDLAQSIESSREQARFS